MSTENKEESEKVECISDQDREAAQNATLEFEKKNYTQSLEYLSKLESKDHDFKVLHNKHVVDFYNLNLTKADQFLANISELFKQFGLSTSKIDDVDYCLAYFNLGVVYYHQKHYVKALNVLEKIYKFIEPMDETLGKHLGLLLVELYLSIKQVDKASTLIIYLNSNWVNQVNLSTKSSKNKNGKDKNKASVKPSSDFTQTLDKFKIRINLLGHKMKLSSGEIKVFQESNKDDVEILFLQANHLYLQGNFDESMQVLSQIPKDAIQYLDSGESSLVLFYNNMGVIHHALGKYNLASYYYRDALKEDAKLKESISDAEKPLYTLGASKYHELMHNLGVSLLCAGKASQAFDCLIVAVRRYHRNCRLWLRIAECCIQVHKASNLADFDKVQKQKEIVVDVLGSGDIQKVIFNTHLGNDKKYSCDSQSYAVPQATLEFATLCLKNAKLLLPVEPVLSPVPLLLIPGANPPPTSNNSCFSPSSPLRAEDRCQLENSVLAATSYVSLCLGDYVVALENAKQLLNKPKISGAHKLLAHLYAAECLVLQDKLTEALEHLSPENIRNIDLTLPDIELDPENEVKTYPPLSWFPNVTPSAIAVMHYNMAVIKCLRGQYSQANALLKQIWQNQNTDCKVPAQIIMLVLYIELQLGHVDVAKNLIKQYSIQKRISG